MRNRWSVLEWEEVEDVAEELKKFKPGVLEMAEEVCGVVNVGRKWKRREWWDESMGVPNKERKVAHGRMKQNGSERIRRDYKEKNSSERGSEAV